MEPSSLSAFQPHLVLLVGLQSSDINQKFLSEIETNPPPVVLSFDNQSEDLNRIASLKGLNPSSPSLWYKIQSALPWSSAKKTLKAFQEMKSIWNRRTSDDMVFLVQFAVHQFVSKLPEMTELDPDFQAIQCIGKNCRNEVIQCLLDPECKKALDCINSCGINDQVCSYRCIASYESKLLEKFSLCILQKHNCLRNSASIPSLPEVYPMETFRNEPLTFETAEDIFIGHANKEKFSWKIAYGKNPAYDYFPCQFQIFYRGKAKGSMWYDPVFKVITLEGKEVWRRRHYRVRRASRPGAFFFSVLDNGVTSNEFWRIVDVDDDLSWALFYYSGAASAAGISYTGAVLGTKDGQPPDDDAKDRIEAALEKCGIKSWELSKVDYSSCDNPPLETAD